MLIMWVLFLPPINGTKNTSGLYSTTGSRDSNTANNIFSKYVRHATSNESPSMSSIATMAPTNFTNYASVTSLPGEWNEEYSAERNRTSFSEFFIYSEEWEDILIGSTYGFLFLIGIIGNVSVMVTSCRTGAGNRSPHRNFLIWSLTVADLLITLLCYPMNAMSLILPYISLPYPTCHFMIAIQSALHASSTFSMAFLAFDRFLTVRKPKLAPKVARWIPHILGCLWTTALVLAVPSGFLVSSKRSYINCRTSLTYHEYSIKREIYVLYYCIIALLVHIMPCIIVSFCHYVVAVSLRQRGIDETRMQQRPKQVIIVARDCSVVGTNTHKIVEASSSIEPSEEEVTQPKKNRRHIRTLKFFLSSTSPVPSRPSRSMRSIIRAHRRMRVRRKVRATSILADHQSHSFDTRIRLSKLLVTLAVTFSCCWIPYAVVLIVWSLFDGKGVHIARNLSLLICNSHSTFSPIVYWLMNRSILNSVQRIVASYLHWPVSNDPMLCGLCPRPKCLQQSQSNWGNNSSTNEEALGPFHPKYVNPLALRPPPSRCTSHYFH